MYGVFLIYSALPPYKYTAVMYVLLSGLQLLQTSSTCAKLAFDLFPEMNITDVMYTMTAF